MTDPNVRRPTPCSRPCHRWWVGILCILGTLAAGPLLERAPAQDRLDDGALAGAHTSGADSEPGAYQLALAPPGALPGGHAAPDLLVLPPPAIGIFHRPATAHRPATLPAPPPARPFDRFSYRTTGPPHRVS